MSKIEFYRSLMAVAMAATLWSVPAQLGATELPKAKGTSRHHARQSVQFQGYRPVYIPKTGDDWSNGWYTPPRSPGFHDDFGS